MITALGWGWRLNPKSLWACSNDDTRQGLGRIASLDLIGSSTVTIRDYGTIVHERKLVLELTQGGFLTNHSPRWLALYGYLQFIKCVSGTESLQRCFLYNVSLLNFLCKIGLFKMIFPQLPHRCALFPGIQHSLCKLQISVQPQNIYKTCQGLLSSLLNSRLDYLYSGQFLIFK